MDSDGQLPVFAIGYVLNIKVLLPFYDISDASSTFFFPAEKPEHYTSIFNAWLIASGVRSSTLPLIGLTGVSLLAALMSFGYLLCVSAANIWNTRAPVAHEWLRASSLPRL